MKEKFSKSRILELVKEVVREVIARRQNEANVTANVDGYNTPYAFQKVPPTKQDVRKQFAHLGSSAYTEPAPKKQLFTSKSKS